LLAVLLGLGLVTTASGHWAGFTHERYFCERELGYKCQYVERHSWGFVSIKHRDTSGNPTLAALARGWDSNQIIFSNVGTGTVRACFEGTYPNCHDQDAYWLYPEIANYGPGNHAVRGHALY